ncbi:DUF4190 domain-containing protein [Luteipulveratus flavus]|uniref:DUF4190 domain-containing protein n=1 Tax=Luteipulveratus flavus TaxID=3031728 RepID=A0ABT6C9F2_9MICO|nr:DUF4190 domain-containing protein [Luteipulveratus sp. YIM 133296]MDF8265520.1 DUF4190 domain-containing protein [Luteipulveratus sp. YIM 133296]
MSLLGCPSCGRAVRADARHCQGCGLPLAGAGLEPADPFATPSPNAGPQWQDTPTPQYGNQTAPYGNQPQQYGNQTAPYGNQPPQYGNQPAPYGSAYPSAPYGHSPYAYGAGSPYGVPQTSGMAIASLVCSLVGFTCGLPFLIGLVLGIVALGETGEGGKDGRGLAIAGIVIGALGTVGLVGLFAVAGFAGP